MVSNNDPFTLCKYRDQIDEQLICPYCQYIYEDTSDLELGFDTDTEIECSSCGKGFTVVMQTQIAYSTYPNCELNGQHHEFEQVTPGMKQCKICSECVLNEDSKLPMSVMQTLERDD